MDIKTNSTSNLVISDEVVAKIATTAACDVMGVAGVVAKPQAIGKMIKTKQVIQPVHVNFRDNQIDLDIYVKLKEGVRVAEVATKIQESVKDAVQNMTSRVVAKVNVHICEVELNKTEE